MKPHPRLPALIGAMALLAACASVDEGAALGPVQKLVNERLGHELRAERDAQDIEANRRRVVALLAQPLSAVDAVQLALLNHRGLQAQLAELGIAAADLAQAARLPNPGFSIARSAQAGEHETALGLHLNLARLLALPLARRVEDQRLAATQAAVAAAVIAHAGDTRAAWVQAVAAQESVHHLQQVLQAAEAGAELARRMAQAGNYNKLQQAREQAFQAEAALNLARAEQRRGAARERLLRLLGLWGSDAAALRLPERLPDLPATAREGADIEQRAIAERLDVQGARLYTEQLARQLGLANRTRFVNVLELGFEREKGEEEPAKRTWELRFELPIFDSGDARVARAEAVYRQQLHRAAAIAIDARSEVREAYAAYRSAHEIARHHREALVPLARRISEENLLRYNGMLIGVFELLADVRAQIGTVHAAIEAQRDFWLADAELDRALLGKPTRLAGLAAGPGGDSSPAASPAAGADAH